MTDLNTQAVALAGEPAVPEAVPPKTPAPTATGDDKIEILSHSLSQMNVPLDGTRRTRPGLEVAIRNISGKTIATAMFEAVLYDAEGSILETIAQREIALEAERSRAVVIGIPPYYEDQVKSYAVRVTRTTTTDVEPVQLRRHLAVTTETGEEEISGIVINLSPTKTDAAVVATFYDPHEVNIGIQVVVLRDIEPNAPREYGLSFKPPAGESVAQFTLAIGQVVESRPLSEIWNPRDSGGHNHAHCC